MSDPRLLSSSTYELAREALGSLPAGHPQRHVIARALDELDAALAYEEPADGD